jgi:hypothetical protein
MSPKKDLPMALEHRKLGVIQKSAKKQPFILTPRSRNFQDWLRASHESHSKDIPMVPGVHLDTSINHLISVSSINDSFEDGSQNQFKIKKTM